MSERVLRRIGLALTISVVVAAIGILNVGAFPSLTAAAECQSDGGGGGGGGGGSPSPSGSGSGTASPTGSSSPSGGGGGPIGQITSLLPGDDESESPTSSPSGQPSSPAGGGPEEGQQCATNVTIQYEKKSGTGADPRDHFKGTLKSRNSQCEEGRTVTVKKVRKGKKAATVGRTVSRRGGAWRVQESVDRGRYYAIAKARSIRGGEIQCLKGKSKTIRV